MKFGHPKSVREKYVLISSAYIKDLQLFFPLALLAARQPPHTRKSQWVENQKVKLASSTRERRWYQFHPWLSAWIHGIFLGKKDLWCASKSHFLWWSLGIFSRSKSRVSTLKRSTKSQPINNSSNTKSTKRFAQWGSSDTEAQIAWNRVRLTN